jgi:putative FmdB family regulatory protein
MPSYKYECPCGQVWDVIHPINVDPEFFCDHCGGVMERKISPVAVTFKGSGFYTTDKNKDK